MQFSTIFAAISALAISAVNAGVIQRDDPHITDFRTFGETGCVNSNQGIYTFTQTTLDSCRTFADPLVASLLVVDINAGCSVSVYADSACSAKVADLTADCFNYEAGVQSYLVSC